MPIRLPALPVALRLPLLAGAAVFLFTVVTSEVVLRSMGHRLDREAARLGRVYLDGLAAAVLPAILEQDRPALDAALARALGFQEGIRERRIVVGTPAGQVLATAGIGPSPDWPAPFLRGIRSEAWEFSEDRDAVWAQRSLQGNDGTIAYLAAALDVSTITARRHRLELALVAFGLALAVLGGALTAYAARQTIRPVLIVTDALGRAGAGRLSRIAKDAMPPPQTEARRLAMAFNGMVAHLADRERLAQRLAERERAATLGRLAATVAHEVRNPLAGMLNAVETARTFGEDQAEREEALEVVERGLQQIRRVVSSTLAMHRDSGPSAPLAAPDLEDLRVLVGPEAARRGVQLAWRVTLPEPFPVDAALLRQAVLNLLLNAIAATPAGCQAGLEAMVEEDGWLAIAVDDAGPGLPLSARRQLGLAAGPDPDAGEGLAAGLGLEVIMTLAQRLAGRIEVAPGPHHCGTRITLRLPPQPPAP